MPIIEGTWDALGVAVAAAALLIIALGRGMLILPMTVKEIRRDRDFWREQAWEQLRNTEQVAEAVDEPEEADDA